MSSSELDTRAAPGGGPGSTGARGVAPDALLARLMLPLRLVLAWIFLAAVWRRLVLAPAKHDPDSAAWLGHKINTFFPHATWPVHDVLAWLLERPPWLDAFTWAFTASEGIVGLLLALGLLSRLTGVGVVGLGAGLMHTSGWLGPTCLSEWHTASLLVTGGALLAFFGAGGFSVDRALERRRPGLAARRWWQRLARPGPGAASPSPRATWAWATALALYVVGMNQVHHGGVWGPLHNHSKIPGIHISRVELDPSGELRFRIFRDRGPETWGAHVIRVSLLDEAGREVFAWDARDLSRLPASALDNDFVNRVRPGPHSLEVPLGARSTVQLALPPGLSIDASQRHRVRLEEVGGLQFTSEPVRVAVETG
jgi:thiosulfate dehydrogenase [quinone] large subunit